MVHVEMQEKNKKQTPITAHVSVINNRSGHVDAGTVVMEAVHHCSAQGLQPLQDSPEPHRERGGERERIDELVR